MNYQGLNNLTIKNQYLLPLISESLNSLGQTKKFIQLYLTNAYYCIRIKEGDEWKTVFQIKYGYFEYQLMSFGFSNTPASFQGYINKILVEKLDIFVIMYLDDILIYTKDLGQGHVEAVWWVLNLPRKNGLFANLKKCQFYKKKLQFLGYVVSSQNIRMEDEKIKIIRNSLQPKSM